MTLISVMLLGAVLFLAYANGANDSFKGVATLFGSRTTTYRQALWWAAAMTFAGSCTAALVAGHLVRAFTGKGLVPDVVAQQPTFLFAVGIGAALTVMLATRTGWPISTTHALTGGLVGAGLASAGSVNLHQLGQGFILPLLVSPLLGCGLTGALYPIARYVRIRLGIEREMCLCVEGGFLQPVQVNPDGTAVLRSTGVTLSVGQLQQCTQRYAGRVFGIDAQWILDRLHFISAGAVSFARGMNDTPKIVALIAGASLVGIDRALGVVVVGVAMGLGGLLNARRVATTMSERITPMNHGQGFTANLITSALVLGASRWGLPVSTTHVVCGSLFGLGAVTGQGRWTTIRSVLLAWVITLPLAALVAAAMYRLL